MSKKNEEMIDTHKITPDPDEPMPKAPNAIRRTPEQVKRLRVDTHPRRIGKDGPMAVGVNMDHTD